METSTDRCEAVTTSESKILNAVGWWHDTIICLNRLVEVLVECAPNYGVRTHKSNIGAKFIAVRIFSGWISSLVYRKGRSIVIAVTHGEHRTRQGCGANIGLQAVVIATECLQPHIEMTFPWKDDCMPVMYVSTVLSVIKPGLRKLKRPLHNHDTSTKILTILVQLNCLSSLKPRLGKSALVITLL
jgi:hypothetical protein